MTTGQRLEDFEPELEKAFLIREFESFLLELFARGELTGTVHTCIGQEFAGIAVTRRLTDQDFVMSNHRGHGHFLSMYEDETALLAEIMGKESGVSGGIGGSQHLLADRFMSNGIQAGMTAVGVGKALAQAETGGDGICVVFIGDGTTGSGLLYESLNLASMLPAPVLFVLENNGYAQSTATSSTVAGTIAGRAEAFGVRYRQADTWNWQQLIDVAAAAVDEVRATRSPGLLEIQTYRLMAHSKGDDTRSEAEVAKWRLKDPLELLRRLSPDAHAAFESAAKERMERSYAVARAAEPCITMERFAVVTERAETWTEPSLPQERVNEQVYLGLRDAFELNPTVAMVGEDIEAPYGGAFKVSRDLSALFPGRVRNMPISEAAMTGLATGRALAGRTTIVEIMFGDFLTLTLDQLLQHAAKFPTMYGRHLPVPLVIRTPMGGRRGYGPTHSQSIEKHFLGIPNLAVLAPNARMDVRMFYRETVTQCQMPTLIIENKSQYTRTGNAPLPAGYRALVSNSIAPCVRLFPVSTKPQATLVCYGGLLDEAEKAMEQLFLRHEIFVEVIAPTSLFPVDMDPIVESVKRTRRLVLIEEGSHFAGWGSEVAALALSAGLDFTLARAGHLGVIPASSDAENSLLIDAQGIVRLVVEVLDA